MRGELIFLVNQQVEDASHALTLMNNQNERIVQIIQRDKQEFEKLLCLYHDVEAKYKDLLESPCSRCAKWQLK